MRLKDYAEKLTSSSGGESELIPAATVILIRDSGKGMETLMLRKNSRIAFAGSWVFPGGRIDEEDGDHNEDMEFRARRAAARETMEETSLRVDPGLMLWFSHWTPPMLGNRRFSTWFFVAKAPAASVFIDDGEITKSQWVRPEDALIQQAEGTIELMPPTYVSLVYLSRHGSVESALTAFRSSKPRFYETRLGHVGDDLVAMWRGDAGYESGDAERSGPRHRLEMRAGGYVFDESAVC